MQKGGYSSNCKILSTEPLPFWQNIFVFNKWVKSDNNEKFWYVQNNRITTTKIFSVRSSPDPPIFKKLQSHPVLIRPKLASVLIQSDPMLIFVHLCSVAYQCWTWSGFRTAIHPDFAAQNRIRIGLDFEKTLLDQTWISKLRWSLQ